MATDKSLRQHYNDIGFSKVKPSKDGSRPGYFQALYGGGGGPPGGGSGGKGGAMHYTAPAPKPVTTAKAPPRILSRPAPSTIIGPSLHGDTGAEEAVEKYTPEYKGLHDWSDDPDYKEKLDYEEPYEMVGGVKVPLSMRGVKGVDPREDPERYFETVEDKLFKNHPEARAEEAEEAIKQLSTKAGTKEALKEFKALKTGRQYVPDVGLLERLGIKKPEGILGSLVDTGQKYFDPKKTAFNLARNYGMKKLGLGALNPWLGLLSLFKGSKFDPFTKGKKPDMSAFSKLGLQTNRFPTQTMDTRTALKARDAYKPPISTQIAKGGGLEKGYEMLGLKQKPKSTLMADVSASDINRLMGATYGTTGQQKYAPNTDIDTIRTIEGPFLNETITDQEIKDVLQRKITQPTGIFAAHGGFIDRPLMGRRDI